jgi:hypothetical protein
MPAAGRRPLRHERRTDRGADREAPAPRRLTGAIRRQIPLSIPCPGHPQWLSGVASCPQPSPSLAQADRWAITLAVH